MALKIACAVNNVVCGFQRAPLLVLRPVVECRCHIHHININDLQLPPKKPMGAFLEFMNDHKIDILKKNPGIKRIPDVAKIASVMWKDLDDEIKQELLENAREKFASYKEKYDAYMQALSIQEKEALEEFYIKRRRVREKRLFKKELQSLGRPKRPPNSYIIFCQSVKLERGNTPWIGYLRELSVRWKNLPEEEKQLYIEEARLSRVRYEQELSEWEQQMVDEGREKMIKRYHMPKV